MTDQDILGAMRDIPGYLDISPGDFLTIYKLAQQHAMQRLFAGVTAATLLRPVSQALRVDIPLSRAAEIIADSGFKGLPVLDTNGQVVGMLTETDYLRALSMHSFLGCAVQAVQHPDSTSKRLQNIQVGDIMSTPVISVTEEEGVACILHAFSRHGGRTLPVLDAAGGLRGLLRRKDLLPHLMARMT